MYIYLERDGRFSHASTFITASLGNLSEGEHGRFLSEDVGLHGLSAS